MTVRHGLLALPILCAAMPLHAATIAVTTGIDEYDTTPNANCSLREAVQSAFNQNDFGGCTHGGFYATASDTINLPAGTFNLTRFDNDDDTNLGDDLDLRTDLFVDGAGAANTIVRVSGIQGRVVHVLNNATVTLQDMTLRDGNVPNGRAGGGVRSEPGTTVTLNRVTVGLNTADGNAGGVLNRGTMTISNSAITNNRVLNAPSPSGGGGGGVFNDAGATLSLVNTLVQGNTVAAPDSAEGGGLLSAADSTLTITQSAFDNNAVNAGFQANGGGLSAAGTVQIEQSTFSNNALTGPGASRGGGIAIRTVSPVQVSRTLVFGNSVDTNAFAEGGGVHLEPLGNNLGPVMLVRDSIVQSNRVHGHIAEGGGLYMTNARVLGSTVADNEAVSADNNSFAKGGGIYAVRTSFIVNSTVAANRSDGEGGGIFFSDQLNAAHRLDSSTVAGNTSNADDRNGGAGGGIAGGASLRLANSVVAGNLENGAGNHDDCDGLLGNADFSLVQSFNGCSFTNGTGNVVNQTAGLAPLADNGGPLVGAGIGPVAAQHMSTRLPLDTSRLLDAGDPAGCRDSFDNNLLATDQLGQTRLKDGPDAGNTADCDIGAVEWQRFSDTIFADGFE